MSAFIVSTSTIEAIVTFAMHNLDSIEPRPGTSTATWVPIRTECPDAIGQALLDENFRSVNNRYRTVEVPPPYRHRNRLVGNVDGASMRALQAVDIVKICHCLAYQSCEHEDWEASWAKRFLDRVIDAATREMPGYDAAPWGLFEDVAQ